MACGAILDAGEVVAPPPPVAGTEEKAATTGGEEVAWHYQLGGRDLGPVSWAEIEELLADTADAEDLLVAREGDEAWRTVADVIGERGNSSSALPAKAGKGRAMAWGCIGALGSLLWASLTAATTKPEDLADMVADQEDEAARAPGPSAPEVRRPIGVSIVVILFVLPGIALAVCTVAAPPLAFITVPIAWFFLHGAQCLHRGFKWARIAFMVLLGLLAVGGVYLLLVSESKGPPAAGIALCVVLVLILDAHGARRYCSR